MLFSVMVLAGLIGTAHFPSTWKSARRTGAAEPEYVQKLRSARHCRSTFPAARQTLDLAKRGSLKTAAMNSVGKELREVSALAKAKGDPQIVFALLSHLGDYGEVIWVDEWSRFSIQLVPDENGHILMPRDEIVRAVLKALDDAGATIVKAGPQRSLVIKKSEQTKYEAALLELGWRDGVSPPWEEH